MKLYVKGGKVNRSIKAQDVTIAKHIREIISQVCDIQLPLMFQLLAFLEAI